MPPVKTSRRYNSPQRLEQGNATRQHILRAAEKRFAKHGFGAVTMKAIAQEANVALATVYLHFDGKAAIVGALADELTRSPDLSVENVERVTDAQELLQRGAQIIGQLNARSWLLTDILRTYGGTDAALKKRLARWQADHLAAVRRGAAAIAHAGRLRPGLTEDQAADILYAVAGTEVYRALVRERGWSAEQYEAWLMSWAVRELLGEE